MSPVAQAVLASWSFPTLATALGLLTALLYLRGWLDLRAAAPTRFTVPRLGSFLSGLAILEIALASPIDAFDPFFLADHMFQHMLLMMVVPPLLFLGDPEIPLLRGLPRWVSQRVWGPLLVSRPMRRIRDGLAHPAVCWLILAVAMIGWHLPAAYERALHSSGWHELEHICFLLASTLFWWPVIQPWPSRSRWPRWTMVIYLLLADFVNSILSAFLVFSDRVLYPSYRTVPRLWGISAQTDQVAAGAIMWAIGSFAFLIPAVLITVRLLSPRPPEPRSVPVPREVRAKRSLVGALALVLPVLALVYGLVVPNATDIDEATLRLTQTSGPFRVSIFAPADPVESGSCDVSVLVQDAHSEEPLVDADVNIAVQPSGGETNLTHATRRQTVNKLLASATVALPPSVGWKLNVLVRRGGQEAVLAVMLHTTSGEPNHPSRPFEPAAMAGR